MEVNQGDVFLERTAQRSFRRATPIPKVYLTRKHNGLCPVNTPTQTREWTAQRSPPMRRLTDIAPSSLVFLTFCALNLVVNWRVAVLTSAYVLSYLPLAISTPRIARRPSQPVPARYPIDLLLAHLP